MGTADQRTTGGTKPDTRVLDYVARAPMTYPVPFDLLPKWPPVPKPSTPSSEEKADRN